MVFEESTWESFSKTRNKTQGEKSSIISENNPMSETKGKYQQPKSNKYHWYV